MKLNLSHWQNEWGDRQKTTNWFLGKYFPVRLVNRTSWNHLQKRYLKRHIAELLIKMSLSVVVKPNVIMNTLKEALRFFASIGTLRFISASFLLLEKRNTFWTVPLALRLRGQPDAAEVVPLDRAVRVVATDHLAVRHLEWKENIETMLQDGRRRWSWRSWEILWTSWFNVTS